jgi:hypothetical protein
VRCPAARHLREQVRTESEVAEEEAAKPKEGSKPAAAQGVLVSKS